MSDSVQIAWQITDDLIEYKLLAVMNIFVTLSLSLSSAMGLPFPSFISSVFDSFVWHFSFNDILFRFGMCIAFIKPNLLPSSTEHNAE